MAPKIKRSLGDTMQFELEDGRLVGQADYYAGRVPEIRGKSAEQPAREEKQEARRWGRDRGDRE